METRNSRSSRVRGLLPRRFALSRLVLRVSFAIPILIAALVLVAGCGAPGEPVAPSPSIPVAVTDLAAVQSGAGVQLTFTLPVKTIAGERLADAPAIEILRGTPKSNGSPDAKSLRIVYTIPSALVRNYRSEDHIQFVDPIPPEQARASAGGALLYRVRTRASRKRTSADSNTVAVRMLSVAERIPSLQTNLAEDAVELTWSAPTRTSSGEPLASISEYHVYRGELDSASDTAAATANPSKDLSQAKWKLPLTFLGSSTSTTYRDTAFEFGKTYAYTVRAVTQPEGHSLESSDSVPSVVTPRDIFPPATPADVRAS